MVTLTERRPEMTVEAERDLRNRTRREHREAEEDGLWTRVGYVWGLLRLGMGAIFMWAFIDKLFGLGFATAAENAWIRGGSPTFGFLNFAAKGPLVSFYNALAGNPVVDWLFMIGLLAVGVTLLLGVGVKLGAYAGALMLALMYTAVLPPEHHPFLDDHIIYAIVMFGLALVGGGRWLGLGNWWTNTVLVRRYRILE